MIASTKSTAPAVASPNGQRFVSIGKASRLLGVSIQSLREWSRAGKIVTYQTIGNHRRFLLSQIRREVLGYSEGESESGGKRIAVYVRVSSKGQSANLERQQERLLAVVCEREHVETESVKVYREIASSFGDRKSLNQLMSDVIAGKVAKIYCENADRLSRVPSLTRLVEHLCKEHHVELVCLDREERDQDEQAQGMAELIEFVHVLAVRTQARKQAERRRKVLNADSLEFVRQELANGRSIRDTIETANKLGYRTEKNEPLSYRVIQRYCNRVFKKMPSLEADNSFATFMAEHVKPKKGSKVQSGAIHSAYILSCRKNGIQPLSGRKCGTWMRENGFTVEIKSGYTWVNEVQIVGYPSVGDAKGEYASKYDNGVRGPFVTYNGRKKAKAR